MKTARAVQPNLGRQAKFKNKLDTFLKSFRNRVLNEILLYLSDAGGLTEDASLTFRPDDPLDRARLRISRNESTVWFFVILIDSVAMLMTSLPATWATG